VKYIDEFRDPTLARKLLDGIAARSTQAINLMEFCGGHTHAIFKFGIRQLLPPTVRLLSGPGCPVCVTANADLDRAIAVARRPKVITATFGDMLKVPGSRSSLQEARAEGADVRIVYSTLDAVQMAQQNPDRNVVFLGIGFETTAPTVAAAVLQAEALGLRNFFLLSMHKLTPPATQAILRAGEVRLSGIIGPGHVTTIIGSDAWQFLPCDHGIPVAVAGFEPLDILRGVGALVEQIEGSQPAVTNAYSRGVRPEGNRTALEVMYRVFEVGDAEWRGLGTVPDSGLALCQEFVHFDAVAAFPVDPGPVRAHRGCRCGEVLRGVVTPPECPLFRQACTPQNPIGPCMVSAEGACAAHFMYGEEV
jgi:hydrogenase expression/formation protein HypD